MSYQDKLKEAYYLGKDGKSLTDAWLDEAVSDNPIIDHQNEQKQPVSSSDELNRRYIHGDCDDAILNDEPENACEGCRNAMYNTPPTPNGVVSDELKKRLLENSQKMNWTTPDGWEVQELIPVEYVMELLPSFITQQTTAARIDERTQAQDFLHGLTITPENSHLFYVLSSNNHKRIAQLQKRDKVKGSEIV